jgi:hypothetical protein
MLIMLPAPPPRLPVLLELRQDVHRVDEHHAFASHSIHLQVLAHRVDHAGSVLAQVRLAREKLFCAEAEHCSDVLLGFVARLGGG